MKTVLYGLYLATKNLRSLHECGRRLYLHVLVPVLACAFRLAGAEDLRARHSIASRDHFNVFMSDIDLTVVTARPITRFMRLHRLLKLAIPALGELEFCSPPHWAALTELNRAPANKLWNATYVVRKIHWITDKLGRAESAYERAKDQRALEILKNRLGVDENPLPGTKIFEDFIRLIPASSPSAPLGMNLFLEHAITLDPTHSEGLLFEHVADWHALATLLPDSPSIPAHPLLCQQKRFLVFQEMLQATTTLQLKDYHGDLQGREILVSWIEQLTLLKSRLDRAIELDDQRRKQQV